MEDAFKTVGLIAGFVGLVALFSHVLTNKPGNPNNMGPYAQGQPMYVGYQCPEIQYQVNPRDPMPFRYNRPRATYGENPIYVRPSTIPNFKFEYEKPRAFREESAMNTPFTYAKPVEVAQPTQSTAYNPGYAWGNYAYVSAIASTPTTRMPYYTHTAPTWRKPAASWIDFAPFSISSRLHRKQHNVPLTKQHITIGSVPVFAHSQMA